MVGPVVLIDALNTFLRAYAAVPTMDANGGRCGGWFGTLRSIRSVIRDFRPSNILVVWDGEGGSQARRSILGEYKANRKVRLNRSDDFGETAKDDLENLIRQKHLTVEYLGMLGIPQVRCDGVEADDLIAWAARHMDIPDVLIVSTDQDMLQLICAPTYPHGCLSTGGDTMVHQGNPCSFCEATLAGPRVKVWSPVKKILFDRDRFIQTYGVLPENYRLMKALTGDAGDNVKGIKGFGPKTVSKIFPGLRNATVSPQQLKEWAAEKPLDKVAVVKKLRESWDQFDQNLSLVDLSQPLLSATAARKVRESLEKERSVDEIEMRIRLVKDGLTISDQAFVSTFREMAARRRHLLRTGDATVS